jgi:hypothetical protein
MSLTDETRTSMIVQPRSPGTEMIEMHYPRSQAWWQRLLWLRKPRCRACGVPWMCDEAKKERVRSQFRQLHNDRTGAWAAGATAAYPEVGRAGYLTLAQAWRGNGGRHA